jgi:hypothetical protein
MNNNTEAAHEEWRPVSGYEGFYEASSAGRIKSVARTITVRTSYGDYPLQIPGRLLRQFVKNSGYPTVSLCRLSVNKTFTVHRLVAIAFIPNPNALPEVNHKDGIKTHNHVGNLEWASTSFNIRHAIQNGLNHPGGPAGKRNGRAQISEITVIQMRRMHSDGSRICDIAKACGVSWSCAAHVLKGRVWTHVGKEAQ